MGTLTIQHSHFHGYVELPEGINNRGAPYRTLWGMHEIQIFSRSLLKDNSQENFILSHTKKKETRFAVDVPLTH